MLNRSWARKNGSLYEAAWKHTPTCILAILRMILIEIRSYVKMHRLIHSKFFSFTHSFSDNIFSLQNCLLFCTQITQNLLIESSEPAFQQWYTIGKWTNEGHISIEYNTIFFAAFWINYIPMVLVVIGSDMPRIWIQIDCNRQRTL